MIDVKYLVSILEELERESYSGVDNTYLAEKFAPTQDDNDKFIYHMDEIWSAGLAKSKDHLRASRWGLEQYLDGSSITKFPLVLTPLGSEVIAELKKKSGVEQFKLSLKKAGTKAGVQAFKVAVDNLLTQAIN